MSKINFTLKTKWSENQKYVIYSGVKEKSEELILLKSLKSAYPTHHDLNQLKSEYALLQKLNHDSVPQVFGITSHENNLRIILQHPEGKNLKSLMGKEIDFPSFFRIAIPLTEALAYLHAQQVIHKNINSKNIYFNSKNNKIQLIGFELAEELAREAFHSNPEAVFETELAYISPEQTGRMNRALDQRTDLYSLGVVFYEMLAQRLPFIAEDSLEMIHCHIAKKHISLTEVSEKIPMVLSNMVDKLLAKNAEDRYQSASGLLHDLQRCNESWKSTSSIGGFSLGAKDVSDRFNISGKLYGRSGDLDILQKSFNNVEQAEIALVSGPSGMGKSALVKEVKKYIEQKKGFFIQGKFDQIKQNAPLNSLLSAFGGLIRQLLTQSEQQIENWKQKVLRAVGTNGRVLTEVIPEVQLLIGEQPPLPALPVAEATTRFNLVFNNFIQVFTDKEHPLCIFLDDMQWIDFTTCQWIETQFSNRQFEHFFLIGAYRDNEVSPSHPMRLMIDHLKQKKVTINDIKLSPLNVVSIAELIANALNKLPEECHDIAKVIVQKTNGNPFFIRQILLALHEKEAIYFSREKSEWAYDIQQIKQTAISDNVIELMTELLHRLPGEVLDTLKTASCIGSDFDIQTLSKVGDLKIEDTSQQLSKASRLGIIASKGTHSADAVSEFSFQHDKIQQAAFSMFTPAERERTHLKIGRLLLQNETAIENNDKIYDITDHLNAAKALITDDSERSKLVDLNLAASIRAQTATAYQPALDYINQAMEMTDSTASGTPAPITRDLFLQKAEAEYLNGNNDIAAEYYDKAVAQSHSDLEKAKIYLNKIHYYNNIGNFKAAYETGRIAIKPLGVNLPAKFIPPLMIKDVLQYRMMKGSRSIKDLLEVGIMTDEKRKMATLLMATVTKSAYQIKPELSIAVSAKIVNQYLKYGHSESSSIGFIAFGCIFHGAILGQKKSGYEFGQLTLDMLEKYNLYKYKSEVHFVVGYFAVPWFDPAQEMERYWQIAYNAGLEVGDFFHSSCAACGTTQSYFMRGVNFDETLQAADRYLDFLNNIKYSEGILTVRGIQQAIKNLQGKTKSKVSYSDDNFDEKAYEKELLNYGSRHFAHYYYINKMRTLYLWKAYDKAYEMLKVSDTYLKDSPGMLHTAEHFFYKGLILAAMCSTTKGIKKTKWKRTLGKINKRFKKYAERCPSNFIHKSQILDAEYHRISGKVTKVQNLYYQALESSKTHKYLHIQALANQLLTRFHQEAGNDRIAGFHLRDALYDYQTLGATAYANSLPGMFKGLSSGIENLYSNKTNNTSSAGAGNIDLSTILKSSEAISQEIRLKDLLSTMMKIIIENAGAQRMVLLLREGDKLLVQAECFNDNQDIHILSKVPHNNYKNIGKSIINYVLNINEPVILDDAAKTEMFANDPYLSEQQVKSVLCAPLSKMGETTGVIYLENNLAEGVFTQERINLIILLSGQIAIAIENAMLYDNLEEKVKERTQELEAEKRKSDELLYIKDRMFRIIGHDLRKPVVGFRGIAKKVNYLLQKKEYSMLEKLSKSIERDTLGLNTLTDNLLNWAMTQTNVMPYHPQSLNLQELVNETFLVLSRIAEDKKVRLESNIQDNHIIYADANSLQTILRNLVDNAIKYTGEGGLVNVNCKISESDCILMVQDNGVGIPSEKIKDLFSLQKDKTTRGTDGEKGTGLGLHLVHELVKLNKATIQVNSEEEKGTTFTLYFSKLQKGK